MIKLGDLAMDTITGFEGVVTSVTTFLHNCDRLCLQPRQLKDGQVAESAWFDRTQLELVSSAAVPVVDSPTSRFNLGAEVADTMSGFRGLVVGIQKHVNGCLRIGVQASTLKDGLPVDYEWLPEGRLRLYEQAPPAAAVRVGGPMSAPRRVQDPR